MQPRRKPPKTKPLRFRFEEAMYDELLDCANQLPRLKLSAAARLIFRLGIDAFHARQQSCPVHDLHTQLLILTTEARRKVEEITAMLLIPHARCGRDEKPLDKPNHISYDS
jgi:hypothetical protein